MTQEEKDKALADVREKYNKAMAEIKATYEKQCEAIELEFANGNGSPIQLGDIITGKVAVHPFTVMTFKVEIIRYYYPTGYRYYGTRLTENGEVHPVQTKVGLRLENITSINGKAYNNETR